MIALNLSPNAAFVEAPRFTLSRAGYDYLRRLGTTVVALTNGQITEETTFALVPSNPVVGQVANISDGSTAVWGANCIGGGANAVLIRWNGSNWTVCGK